MVLFCSSELFDALDGLQFPADKQTMIDYADSKNTLEAVNVALNELQEGVLYNDIGSVCENAKIACDLEIYRALEGLDFPAGKEKIIPYAKSRNASPAAIMALEKLTEHYEFRSVSEICENA